MKLIKLSQGQFSKVDNEDFDFLNQFTWFLSMYGYAIKNSPHALMHRLITNCPKNKEVDHINGDKKDNRKFNLRIVTHQQNCLNSFKYRKKCTSQFKGVYFHKKKWATRICYNGKIYWLGRFKKEKEAALAYNKKAQELFGEFAKLNIV